MVLWKNSNEYKINEKMSIFRRKYHVYELLEIFKEIVVAFLNEDTILTPRVICFSFFYFTYTFNFTKIRRMEQKSFTLKMFLFN